MSDGLTEGIGGILQRAGQIFHIFDLSFFASGAVTFAAIATSLRLAGWFLPSNTPIWTQVIVFVFGSYISGVASFAVGRQLRRFSRYRQTLHLTLERLLNSHGLLADASFSVYFGTPTNVNESDVQAERNRMAYRLYSRLWAELRDSYTSSEGYRMLSRYWVMAAMYDGLVFSFILWAAIATVIAFGWLGAPTDVQQVAAAVIAVLFAGLACVCSLEGLRNFEYQVEDICATFAARRAPLSAPQDFV